MERLFLGTYKVRRWTRCIFFLHLSARTLLNVIQDHFDDLANDLCLNYCMCLCSIQICLVNSYLFIICVCLCGLILLKFFNLHAALYSVPY